VKKSIVLILFLSRESRKWRQTKSLIFIRLLTIIIRRRLLTIIRGKKILIVRINHKRKREGKGKGKRKRNSRK